MMRPDRLHLPGQPGMVEPGVFDHPVVEIRLFAQVIGHCTPLPVVASELLFQPFAADAQPFENLVSRHNCVGPGRRIKDTLVDDLDAFDFQNAAQAANVGPLLVVMGEKLPVDDQLAQPVAYL